MEMATTFSASSLSHRRNFFAYSDSKSFNSYSLQPLIFSPFHPHRHSLPIRLRSNSSKRPRRSLSAGPGPQSPPDSDPARPRGFAGKLSRFQDRVQIFFAVLFWMSLFFWSSAWDGRNSGRPNKGSRFRR
ncbi:uncharacterized protein LOC111278569 [Durio zibethinus]|uniref:Uncharacterized protein LOC111278569 n=1 Tax=Durio zibethinus TaxID=66656 RepID=A0A6P5WXU1_DURZI|nr:uncharacterized protein LOC111278569 [Durio zibethinus]